MNFSRTIVALLLSISIAASAQEGVFAITKYGAKGDEKTVNTIALQQAINACYKNGGGEVIVPPGVFIIGTVHLKSNVHLVIKSGGVLKGSSHLGDYEVYIPPKPFTPIHKGMLFTEDAQNVTISGEGTIDGNGEVYFDSTKAKKIDSAGTSYSRQKQAFRKVTTGIGDGPVVPLDRPYQMFVFSNCKNISVRDINIRSAPFWCMHFADCDAVNVSRIKLWNSMLAPNADGIDVTSCTNVIISDCDIRAGDDAIAITGYDHHFEIPGYRGLRHISENILVSNCTLQSASSGIRIGFLDQNTVRNINVVNVNITNSTRGIGIFLRDEGSLENISFSNMYIQTILRTGDWWGNGEPIHISAIRGKEGVKLGTISNVQFSNITCKGENGMLVYGSDETAIEHISFDNIRFELVDSKLNDVAGGNIDLRGVLDPKAGLFQRDIPALLIEHAHDVSINHFTLEWTRTRMPFFTHGIEADRVNGLKILHFDGSASPVNRTAYRVYVHHGAGFETNNQEGVKLENNK